MTHDSEHVEVISKFAGNFLMCKTDRKTLFHQETQAGYK